VPRRLRNHSRDAAIAAGTGSGRRRP
jgi:hypothetical protein